MKDLAIVTGVERNVLVAGELFRVPKFTPSIVGRINAWLKDQVPNPKDLARQRMEGLPDAVALAIWQDALQEAKEWPPAFGTPAGDAYLMRYDGASRILYELLSATTPGFTVDRAQQMIHQIGVEGLNHIIELAGGEIRTPVAEGDLDPKA